MTDKYYATGRRKNAIAKVWLTKGSGQIKINKRDIDEYFPREAWVNHATEALNLTETKNDLDFNISVLGGGLTGQSGAVRLGIARILIQIDSDLRTDLKKAGMLTRDSREVERKKYGQPGARKRFQFSKR